MFNTTIIVICRLAKKKSISVIFPSFLFLFFHGVSFPFSISPLKLSQMKRNNERMLCYKNENKNRYHGNMLVKTTFTFSKIIIFTFSSLDQSILKRKRHIWCDEKPEYWNEHFKRYVQNHLCAYLLTAEFERGYQSPKTN